MPKLLLIRSESPLSEVVFSFKCGSEHTNLKLQHLKTRACILKQKNPSNVINWNIYLSVSYFPLLNHKRDDQAG